MPYKKLLAIAFGFLLFSCSKKDKPEPINEEVHLEMTIDGEKRSFPMGISAHGSKTDRPVWLEINAFDEKGVILIFLVSPEDFSEGAVLRHTDTARAGAFHSYIQWAPDKYSRQSFNSHEGADYENRQPMEIRFVEKTNDYLVATITAELVENIWPDPVRKKVTGSFRIVYK